MGGTTLANKQLQGTCNEGWPAADLILSSTAWGLNDRYWRKADIGKLATNSVFS